MRAVLFIALLALAGCGSAPEPAPAPAKPEPARVKDLTSMLPSENRTSAKVVQDHLLDQPKMPGGSIGDYEVRGEKYQLFVIDVETNQKAAFLLVDMKDALKNPEYIGHMGGYFGTDSTSKPVFVFAKLHYLAGVVGLPQAAADPIARVLAARL